MTLQSVKNTKKPFARGAYSVIAILVSLTGCGQKGDLYMPEEANSNTDFILYKNNKDKTDIKSLNSDESEGSVDIDSIANDPNDY